jgi:hypothetical protein
MPKQPHAAIATQLSDGLVHLLLADAMPGFENVPKWIMSDTKDFDGWEPFDATNVATEEQYCGGDIDCVTAMPVRGGEGWAFAKVSKLSTRHWRGRLYTFPPQSFDLMIRSTNNDGTATSVRLPIVRTSREVRLHPQIRGGTSEPQAIYEDIADILLKPGIPLEETFAALSTHRKRSYWNIYLGYPGMARSRLATDPRGARAFFADRDVGQRERRAALLHWVAGHWRKRRPPNDEDTSWVREHMRGKRDFLWNGMRGEVMPAEFTTP